MAWMVHGTANAANQEVGALTRVRGNVTLHVCIGGGGCQASAFTATSTVTLPGNADDANKITGTTHDLEYALSGGWVHGNGGLHRNGRHAFAGDFLLDGAIAADGSCSGAITPDGAGSTNVAGQKSCPIIRG